MVPTPTGGRPPTSSPATRTSRGGDTAGRTASRPADGAPSHTPTATSTVMLGSGSSQSGTFIVASMSAHVPSRKKSGKGFPYVSGPSCSVPPTPGPSSSESKVGVTWTSPWAAASTTRWCQRYCPGDGPISPSSASISPSAQSASSVAVRAMGSSVTGADCATPSSIRNVAGSIPERTAATCGTGPSTRASWTTWTQSPAAPSRSGVPRPSHGMLASVAPSRMAGSERSRSWPAFEETILDPVGRGGRALPRR